MEDYPYQILLSTDPDARVGHETADSSFFGYKTHKPMNDERLIPAVIAPRGEQSEWKYLQDLIKESQETNGGITERNTKGKDVILFNFERNNVFLILAHLQDLKMIVFQLPP